jgi:hypothetical protein
MSTEHNLPRSDLPKFVAAEMLSLEERNQALSKDLRMTGAQKRESLQQTVRAKYPDDEWAPMMAGGIADQYVKFDNNEVRLHPAICAFARAIQLCCCGSRTGAESYRVQSGLAMVPPPPRQEMVDAVDNPAEVP